MVKCRLASRVYGIPGMTESTLRLVSLDLVRKIVVGDIDI